MDWFLATILGALIFGSGGFAIKWGTVRGNSDLVLFGLYLVGSLCFFAVALFQNTLLLTPEILLAGVIIGLGSVLGNVFWVKAFAVGPSSLTGPLINSYNALVVIMSIVVFGEQLTINEILGIILLMASVSLIGYDPDEELAVRDWRWYWFVLVAILFFFTRNGGLKIAEESGTNNTILLAYGYMVGIVWFGVAFLRTAPETRSPGWRPAFLAGAISGIFSFGGLLLFTYAISTGPASIVSPVFSTNGLIFAGLTMLFLGERLSRYQLISMLGTVIAIILLRV